LHLIHQEVYLLNHLQIAKFPVLPLDNPLLQKNAQYYFDAILNNSLLCSSDVMEDDKTTELKNYFKTYQVKSLIDGVVNEGLNKRILCVETSTHRNYSQCQIIKI